MSARGDRGTHTERGGGEARFASGRGARQDGLGVAASEERRHLGRQLLHSKGNGAVMRGQHCTCSHPVRADKTSPAIGTINA